MSARRHGAAAAANGAAACGPGAAHELGPPLSRGKLVARVAELCPFAASRQAELARQLDVGAREERNRLADRRRARPPRAAACGHTGGAARRTRAARRDRRRRRRCGRTTAVTLRAAERAR